MKEEHLSQRATPTTVLVCALLLGLVGTPVASAEQLADGTDTNNPGILEPVTSAIENRIVRIPNTDQSVDGLEQSTVEGEIVLRAALGETSLTGHPIARSTSPNDDMRLALQAMVTAAQGGDGSAMRTAAADLQDILLGTTEGRIYDGFSMLNYNRGAYVDGHVADEYKMKLARDTGETYESPYDGEQRRIWEVDIAMLFYDGQIDSDTFFVRFPFGHHDDDVLRVNYRIYSLVQEDFSPTLVMLDKRRALNTVQFPFKGFDATWIAFEPNQVLDVTVNYPPVRQLRGVYTWGWRLHPPRIQFMQPLYEIRNAHTGEIELDPQSESYAFRNRTELSIDRIAAAAPEKKMYEVARAALDGASPQDVLAQLTSQSDGPAGTWIEWSDLVKNQNQLPSEAWDLLAAEEGLGRGDFGTYNMISVYMNNEMYGAGPFQSEIKTWRQGEIFRVKLINLDGHTHYFRNVDFGTRLNDDILRCCGGGETSFEVMNFKPSYGAPKVAEMQWRAGWGFRPHYDVIQQSGVFSRGIDRVKLEPYTGGFGGLFHGYKYSEEARGGDFRFNPPPFIVSDEDPPFLLRDSDGENGLVIGQFTEGYGEAQMCPGDAYPGFCATDIQQYNPHGSLNWPPPPLQGTVDADGNVLPDEPTELRFPPFLRNPSQAVEGAGDIIPPTGAWRPFLWINPANGTLYIDPEDPSKGFWADLTYSHGRPIYAGGSITATIELPRSSGQVFYQFDDLFHDNAIFSPHPVSGGLDQNQAVETLVDLQAWQRDGELRVIGQLSGLGAGQHAEWVTLFHGSAGEGGCTGEVRTSAPVKSGTRFVLRLEGSEIAAGESICVEAGTGAFAEGVVRP